VLDFSIVNVALASIERESIALARELFARWLIDVVGIERERR